MTPDEPVLRVSGTPSVDELAALLAVLMAAPGIRGLEVGYPAWRRQRLQALSSGRRG